MTGRIGAGLQCPYADRVADDKVTERREDPYVCGMILHASMMAGLARQLAHPQGVRGRLVGAMLNRANQTAVTAAVKALPLTDGDTVADNRPGGVPDSA